MTKCICNDPITQTENVKGEFFDPQNKLPKNKEGFKIRSLFFGCPSHNGTPHNDSFNNKYKGNK